MAAARTLTPGEYRHDALRARRWAMHCLEIGEVDEARHQLKEAARMFAEADAIEQERKAA